MPVSVLPDLGLSGIYRTYYLSRYAKGTKGLIIGFNSFWYAESKYDSGFAQSLRNFAVLPVSVLPDLDFQAFIEYITWAGMQTLQ